MSSSTAAEQGSSSSSSKPRTVKLLCPALSRSNTVPYAAWEEQRLDLSSIAMAFGLEPRTLKLNGHFIGRGSDLISSMTWRSLLSYFSGKGLRTGTSDGEALIVDGKLCRAGSKRGKQDDQIDYGCCSYGETHKKLKQSNCSGGQGKIKRELAIMEDINLLKKLKLEETNSPVKDVAGKENQDDQGITAAAVGRLKCRSMKRTREEDGLFLLAAPCKRIH